MWVNLIEEIHPHKTEAKYGDELNSPATDQEIRKFEKAVLGKFPVNEIPSGYKKFLQTVNGLDFNGLVIYRNRR